MSFDGTGDYVQLPWNTPFALGGGNFTVECWVYPTTSGVATGLISNWQTGGQFILRKNASNRPVLVFTAGSAVTLTGTTTTIVTGMWNHVAAVRNGSTFTLYVNGVADATTATNASAITGTGVVMRVGADGDASSLFTGFISEARIIPGTAFYTSNFVPPVAPLTPVTNTTLLLNGTAASIYDSSTQNNLETVGDARNVTDIIRYGNTSMFFDGTGDYLLAPASPTLDFGTGDFTIETWVNFTALSSNRLLLDRWVTGNANGWQLYWRSTGTSMTFLTGASTVLVQDPNGSNITTGTWNHIAVTRSGTTVRLFVNGILVATNTSSVSFSSTLPLGVGIQTSTITNPLNGYLSDTRITRGVARYTANFTPPTAAFQTK
jgi:hypothetical protein